MKVQRFTAHPIYQGLPNLDRRDRGSGPLMKTASYFSVAETEESYSGGFNFKGGNLITSPNLERKQRLLRVEDGIQVPRGRLTDREIDRLLGQEVRAELETRFPGINGEEKRSKRTKSPQEDRDSMEGSKPEYLSDRMVCKLPLEGLGRRTSERQRKPKIKGGPVLIKGKEVVDSLTSGFSLREKMNMNPNLANKVQNIGFRIRTSDLNLLKRQRAESNKQLQEGQEELSSKQSFQRLKSDVSCTSTLRGYDLGSRSPFPLFSQRLPKNLQIQGQTTNEFYRRASSPSSGRSPLLDKSPTSSVSVRKELIGYSRRGSLGKEQLLHKFRGAVRRVLMINRTMRAMRQRLREVEAARFKRKEQQKKEEQILFKKVLKALGQKVQEVQAEREKELLRLEQEKQEKEAKRKEEERLLRKKRKKERVEKAPHYVLDSQHQDRFSARKVTSIKPYKSYWLKCVENCLAQEDLYSEDKPHSSFDAGYYRVILPHKKEKHQPGVRNLENLDTKILETHPHYFWRVPEPNKSGRYIFEHESEVFRALSCSQCLEEKQLKLEEDVSKANTPKRPLSAEDSVPVSCIPSQSEILSPPAETWLDEEATKKVLTQGAKMISRIDGDILREYPLLFSHQKEEAAG